MKGKYRLLLYLVLGSSYFLLTFGFLWLDNTLHINNMFVSVGLGFTITNFLATRYVFKSHIVYDLLAGLMISYASLNLCLWLGWLEPFPTFDPYGILTAIANNALLSILFLETIYRIKVKYLQR